MSDNTEHSYMGHKGKTSESLLKYLSRYDIDQQIVSCGLSLIQKSGYNPTIEGVTKRIEPISINSIVIEVVPSASGKGTVKFLDVNKEFSTKWSIPSLNKDMLNYVVRDFLGYKLYLHPEHVSHAKEMERNGVTNRFRVQLLIIPGRGCITLPVSLN